MTKAKSIFLFKRQWDLSPTRQVGSDVVGTECKTILRQHVSYLSRISASEQLTELDDAKESRVRSSSFENGLEMLFD